MECVALDCKLQNPGSQSLVFTQSSPSIGIEEETELSERYTAILHVCLNSLITRERRERVKEFIVRAFEHWFRQSAEPCSVIRFHCFQYNPKPVPMSLDVGLAAAPCLSMLCWDGIEHSLLIARLLRQCAGVTKIVRTNSAPQGCRSR